MYITLRVTASVKRSRGFWSDNPTYTMTCADEVQEDNGLSQRDIVRYVDNRSVIIERPVDEHIMAYIRIPDGYKYSECGEVVL